MKNEPSFAPFRVYSKSSKSKYEIDIELPFNIFNLKKKKKKI